VDTVGGYGWWIRLVDTVGGYGWWIRLVDTVGGYGWWIRLVYTVLRYQMEREVLKAFDGAGDVATWLKKVKLVAKLKSVVDIATLLPLYLEGPAFAVFDQLSDEDKGKTEVIESTLLSAFALNQFAAYDVLRARCLTQGESVDVYLADIKRLAGLAKIDGEGFIRCAFVTGLPRDVSIQLRAAAQIGTISLAAILEQARVLVGERTYGAMAAVGKRVTSEQQIGNKRCFHCDGEHLSRFCNRRTQPTCWKCGKLGHISRNCSGNGQERLLAPTPSQT
jgi:hypothetical protein